MRYHYEKPAFYAALYGETYECSHPVYRRCTLFRTGEKGLAVIQQRWNPETRHAWWTEIDPWLTVPLYTHPAFPGYFAKRAAPAENGLYPTVTVRQMMWALKLKPLPKERWETVFDRRTI